ncbi:hypothetical protein ABFS82_12G022100 [Erythranthe guttata]|uniref:VQ domain-containing protein n=1 Tax=Erythranthe guttata TaxID=4155 RepID=A0A022RMS9_ERYGU|nr:PREDICTED: VQ motif-containing protein 29-like [Erythranthe guttata]EYU41374.1 hypothetical protein MIMGU_mgv1a019582mg [Erythranthe guttata]|eukprot:XP_012832547.1 PREDICTED: VQ motif-containing protein 29-like [Erythranthe guttata]
MDSYYSYNINEYSNYSSSTHQFPYYNQYNDQHQQIRARRKQPPPPPAFTAALHSVRKFPAKSFIPKKLPIAPIPRTPPKLYKVDPADFKDAVQKLTGLKPELRRPTRLQEVAPPPLRLSPPAFFHPSENWDNAIIDVDQEEEKESRKSFEKTCGALSPLGFTLSPASLAWCSSILMSPGTLAFCSEPTALL